LFVGEPCCWSLVSLFWLFSTHLKIFFLMLLFSHLVMSGCLQPMDCSTPGFPVLHHFLELLKLTSIEFVTPSSHLILRRPFLLLASIFPASGSFPVSQLFVSGGQSSGALDFSISPSNEFSELISFRINWFDLLAVQGTLKSLLQHHSSKAPILQCSAFFMV